MVCEIFLTFELSQNLCESSFSPPDASIGDETVQLPEFGRQGKPKLDMV